MSNTNHITPADSEVVSYPSLASLREDHLKLLKEYRSGETNYLLDQIEAFIQRAKSTGAILDADSDRQMAQGLLDFWATVLYRARRNTPEALLAEFDLSLAPNLDDALCPYRGLNAFLEEDEKLFFGRRRFVMQMVETLREKRIIFVVGPSGSGKSSLVLAGLLPALKKGALTGSENWRYLPSIVPGSNPLTNLASAISPDCEESADGPKRQPKSFGQDYILKLLSAAGDNPSLIVVDQFEEIVTLCTDDTLRGLFVDNLVRVVQAQGPRHTVILTLRSDFEPFIALFPALQSLFEQSQIRVTPLAVTDLREAIEGPAKIVGLKFEDGVIDRLINEVLGEPAGLPLLQFSLLTLWDQRKQNWVTWKAYNHMGGARVALASAADRLYNSLIMEDQTTVMRIMLRLALPGEGVEVTRARVRRRQLYEAGGAPYRVDRVLEKLITAGLVRLNIGEIPDDDQVEIAHEALARNWPRLVEWLDDNRVRLRQRLLLTGAAEQWLRLEKDPSGLLRGSFLDEVLRYDDLNDLENQFVQASLAAKQESEQYKEAGLQQKLEQLTLTAKRLRWSLGILTFIYLLTLGAMIFVWIIKANK